MRIVVTNDDGVESPGLHALAAAARASGHEVSVVAPLRDYSGFGAAVGPLHVTGEVRFERVGAPALPDVEVVGVDGPPALCVLAACLGGFGPRPDVVLSGVNAGPNIGRAVLHSGTVGAALTANNFGVPAIAVSLTMGSDPQWRTAAAIAADLVEWATSTSPPLSLNVNVPDAPLEGLVAHATALDLGGQVQTTMVESSHGVLSLQVHAGQAPVPGTDAAALAAGCVAITPLGGVHAVEIVVEEALARIEALAKARRRVA